MTLFRLAPIVVLAGSVAGNVVLARAVTVTGAATPIPTHAPGARPTEALSPRAAPRRVAGPCGQEVADLERAVAGRSGAVRAVLPPHLLFERGLPNAEAERVMAPVVAAALTGLASPAGNERLECRDVACRIVFTHPATAADNAWDQALARHPDFQAWSHTFGPGETRPLDTLTQQTVYFKLDGPRAQQER